MALDNNVIICSQRKPRPVALGSRVQIPRGAAAVKVAASLGDTAVRFHGKAKRTMMPKPEYLCCEPDITR